MKRTKINTAILTLPAVTLIIVGLVFAVVLPIRNRIKELKGEVTSEYVKLENQYVNGQLLKKIQVQYNAIEPDLPRVKASLLKQGQELFLITTLEKIASRHNLVQEIMLDDLVVDPEAEVTGLVTLPTRVELTGTFADILGYIADVEALNFYVNWQLVDIKSQTQTQSRLGVKQPNQAPSDTAAVEAGEILRASLRGETYWKLTNN